MKLFKQLTEGKDKGVTFTFGRFNPPTVGHMKLAKKMKQVSKGVNALRSAHRSFLIITHYQRLLDHIKPDYVHIMANGRIIKTGGPELALEVEEKGYEHLIIN